MGPSIMALYAMMMSSRINILLCANILCLPQEMTHSMVAHRFWMQCPSHLVGAISPGGNTKKILTYETPDRCAGTDYDTFDVSQLACCSPVSCSIANLWHPCNGLALTVFTSQ